MHTEDEAKKIWCPMVRVVNFQPSPDDNYPINRPTSDFNCIASGCMMWRKHDQIGIDPNGKKVTKDLDGRTRWVDRGYCGLAGSNVR